MFKGEKKLLKLCKNFAEEVIGEEIYVFGEYSGNFMMSTPTTPEQELIYSRDLHLRYKKEGKKTMAEHRKIEQKYYYKIDYGLDYFTMAFLHEIGHFITTPWFNELALDQAKEIRDLGGHDLESYKMLPHEMLADLWSLKMFIPNNWEKVRKLDEEIKRLLHKIRKDFKNS